MDHCQVLFYFFLDTVYLQVTSSTVFPSSILPSSQEAKFEERSNIRTLFNQGLNYCFSSTSLLISTKIHQVLDTQVGSIGYPISKQCNYQVLWSRQDICYLLYVYMLYILLFGFQGSQDCQIYQVGYQVVIWLLLPQHHDPIILWKWIFKLSEEWQVFIKVVRPP